jgi:hypothetical protein
MRHCTPDELIDLADGTRAEADLPHLEACAACRQQVLEARQLLAEVREVEVPEPSPEQWARLSARVHDAVAAEGVRSWPARWPAWTWVAPAAAAAALAVAVAVPRFQPPAPVPVPSAQTAETAPAGAADPAAPTEREPLAEALDDPALVLMVDLADAVDLDADSAPLLAMGAGTLDEAVSDLSADEAHELARLLKEVIGASGG